MINHAGVVELVDTPDLGSGDASRGGSSPSARTTWHNLLHLMKNPLKRAYTKAVSTGMVCFIQRIELSR